MEQLPLASWILTVKIDINQVSDLKGKKSLQRLPQPCKENVKGFVILWDIANTFQPFSEKWEESNNNQILWINNQHLQFDF